MQQAKGHTYSASGAIWPRRIHHQTVTGWAMMASLVAATAVPSLASAQGNDVFAVSAGSTPEAIALDEVLGKAPKTVFVPGRLYRNGQGALFIDGQRFAAANGARDVAGFLAGSGSYLVAVRANVVDVTEQAGSLGASGQATKPLFTEDELRKLPPEMRLKALQAMGAAVPPELAGVKFGNGKPNGTVFYRCSTAISCTIARVVKGLPELHITDNKIWFSVPSQSQRIGREFVSTLLTYSGIDINGASIDGPAGVLYAAPLPKGEWMIKKLEKEYVSSIDYSWAIRSSEGSDRVLFSGSDLSRDFLQVTVPSSIVLDATPVSPSAAYGVLSVTTGGYERMYGDWRLYNWPVCATAASKNRLLGTALSVSDTRQKAAFMAEQVAVIPIDGKAYAFGQTKVRGNLLLGMAEVDCEKAVLPEKGVQAKPYAYIEKDGFSFSSGQPNTSGLGGFVHIRSPNGNVILLSDRLKEGKPLPGIRVEDGKRIEAADAQRFLERYGIVNE